MKVLITGISGFVGEYLAKLIFEKEKKAEVYGLERSVQSFKIFHFLNNNVKIFEADITNENQVEKVIKEIKPDIIFHLAGFASAAGRNKDLIFSVNVQGTMNILKSVRNNCPNAKLLLISSSYIYGNTPSPANEESLNVPKGYYAESKLEMEKRALLDFPELNIFIARPVNHIGPGQKIGFVVPDFASQIVTLKSGDKIVVGNLQAERDFLDVCDVVEAYLTIIKKGKKGEIYNISSGNSQSIESILKNLIKLSGKKIKIEIDKNKMRPSEIKINCLDNSKLKKLGWSQKKSITETLKKTYLYWKEINENCN